MYCMCLEKKEKNLCNEHAWSGYMTQIQINRHLYMYYVHYSLRRAHISIEKKHRKLDVRKTIHAILNIVINIQCVYDFSYFSYCAFAYSCLNVSECVFECVYTVHTYSYYLMEQPMFLYMIMPVWCESLV